MEKGCTMAARAAAFRLYKCGVETMQGKRRGSNSWHFDEVDGQTYARHISVGPDGEPESKTYVSYSSADLRPQTRRFSVYSINFNGGKVVSRFKDRVEIPRCGMPVIRSEMEILYPGGMEEVNVNDKKVKHVLFDHTIRALT